MVSRIVRLLAWLVIVAIIVLSLLPGKVRPPFHPFAVTQFEHLVAYFAAGVLLGLGYSGRNHAQVLSGLLLMLLAASLEVSQLWIPGRTARILDWFSGTAGGWAGVGVAWLACYKLNRRPEMGEVAQRH